MTLLRLGTRRSALAMAQADAVSAALREQGCDVEIVAVTTRGDRTPGRLADAGGKGLFTSALEDRLADGAVDLAVHSAKDMPAAMDARFDIAVVPVRADPRDALVGRAGPIESLPTGARIGTGSVRRAAQLRALRPDVRIEPIRGNVDTRLRRAVGDDADLDAVVLAMAGLDRLGLIDALRDCVRPLPVEACVPAGGQGTLAVQILAGRDDLRGILAPLDDPDSLAALRAERAVLRALQADCHSCIGVHVARSQREWLARSMTARPNGTGLLRLDARAPSADQAGQTLQEKLLSRGGAQLLR